ncbi:RES family NAD+ phosphorylase [Clavibacter sepedonicus]|uniref:RES family NAD+ phosphorylase n=1 Tax=Clavibacter sepedonicus TaxID=31964 RepID=UPI001CC262D4|nr:RES family NAD+ phosphorylase [Clavibacter sepedonicus]UUK64701.1 RES family NAD+ phosphorylase [Clavibacter sepedonicus]
MPTAPSPFTSIDEIVPAGMGIHRIHSARFGPAEFNPGIGGPTRFAFFGEPVIPVLYAGDTEDVAVCETILHDVPLSGGVVGGREVVGRRCSRLIAIRDLRLASLVGGGPRALRVRADSVCATDAADYPQTVAWAAAAHAAGFEGLAYPSRQAAGRRAMVLFGDRVSPADLEPDPAYRWWFDDVDGFAKLYEMCRPLGVTVLRFA